MSGRAAPPVRAPNIVRRNIHRFKPKRECD